jgi:hypothetical protein
MTVISYNIVGLNLARHITAAHTVVIVVANLRIWYLHIINILVILLIYLLCVL